MVTIKKETREIIEQLREMTGEPEEQVINNAVERFFDKRLSPIIATMTILGFGVFQQVFTIFSQ